MYLYSTDGLDDYPQTLGPGVDPIGSQKTMCPLLRRDGRDLDWLDYVLRTKSPDDPLSKYKKFLNEVAYRAYLESCKMDSIDELKKRIRLPFPITSPPPRTPNWLDCRQECLPEVEKCPGGKKNMECLAKGRDCVKRCMGVPA